MKNLFITIVIHITLSKKEIIIKIVYVYFKINIAVLNTLYEN